MELASEQPVGLHADLEAQRERAAERADLSAVKTRRVVYSAAVVYAVLFAVAAAVVYFAYQQQRLDLGNMVQAVWSTAHGDFLQATSVAGRQTIRLAGHVDPFLALFVPLWWVWPSPLMLLIVQAAAVAAGALPVYWLARKHLRSERAAAHFAFAYLLFPATQFNAFTIAAGPHPVSFAIPLILFAIWFLDEDRLLPFAIVALLAASTKEEIPAAIACLGIWYAVRKGKRVAGLTIFVLGIGTTLVNFLLVIPHYSVSGVSPFAGRYEKVGGTPGGMLHKAVSDPVAFLHAVATWHKLLYLGLVFLPFLGLWLLEPLLLLGAVPDLVINLLSANPLQTTIQFQYTAGIIPFLIAASIFGAAKLKRDPDRVSFYALAGAACIALYSPIYFAKGDIALARSSNPTHAAKAHALDLIPSGVPVTASNQLGAYLSARRVVYVFPVIHEARWVIVDRNDDTFADQSGYRRAIAELDADPRWKVVYASHGVQVLRKLPAPKLR